MDFALPPALLAACCPEGSICLDGVSLTIAGLQPDGILVSVIPHTLAHTTLGRLVPDSPVNVETDLVARYVLGLHSPRPQASAETSSGLPDPGGLAASLQDWGY